MLNDNTCHINIGLYLNLHLMQRFLNESTLITLYCKMSISADDELAINNFREYLRIPSVHPNIDYGK